MYPYPLTGATKIEGDQGGRGPSPGLWGKLAVPHVRGSGVYAGDDFLQGGGSLTANYIKWSPGGALYYALYGSSGASSVSAALEATTDGTQNPGALAITIPLDGQEAYLSQDNTLGKSLLMPISGKQQFVFEARVKFNHVLSGTDALAKMIGLAGEGRAASGTIGASELGNGVFIGFRALTSAANEMDAVYATTTPVVHLDAGVFKELQIAANTYKKFGLHFNGKRLFYYVDGLQVGAGVSLNATGFPANKGLVPIFGGRSAGATSKVLTIDWWAMARIDT